MAYKPAKLQLKRHGARGRAGGRPLGSRTHVTTDGAELMQVPTRQGAAGMAPAARLCEQGAHASQASFTGACRRMAPTKPAAAAG